MIIALLLVAAGITLLVVGGEVMLRGAVRLATLWRLSPAVIGLTVVAAGTSIPELAVSGAAAMQGSADIAMANVVGSNIFNIASVLGLTAIIKPIAVIDDAILSTNIFWMIGFAAILLPLAFIPKRLELSRYKGLILFVAYIVFVGLTFL